MKKQIKVSMTKKQWQIVATAMFEYAISISDAFDNDPEDSNSKTSEKLHKAIHKLLDEKISPAAYGGDS